jgi:hypothetical protein
MGMSTVEKVSLALSNDLLRVLKRAVASGEYASSSEVVREALREWRARRPAAGANGGSSGGFWGWVRWADNHPNRVCGLGAPTPDYYAEHPDILSPTLR